TLPGGKSTPASVSWQAPQLLLKLSEDMAGARGLAVSPDRQLITFLAPMGEQKGTDIYGFRPDGTDLSLVVSHSDPSAPFAGEKQLLTPDQQAIKSYVWTDGRLEYGGYQYNMLLTCGDWQSPTLYRGGFLYSAPSGLRAPV